MENKKASLISYIKMDLYRGFFSTKFFIAFIGLCLSLLLGLLQAPKLPSVLDVFFFLQLIPSHFLLYLYFVLLPTGTLSATIFKINIIGMPLYEVM